MNEANKINNLEEAMTEIARLRTILLKKELECRELDRQLSEAVWQIDEIKLIVGNRLYV